MNPSPVDRIHPKLKAGRTQSCLSKLLPSSSAVTAPVYSDIVSLGVPASPSAYLAIRAQRSASFQ